MWALVRRSSAYNDGNGCSSMAQAQRFPMHAFKLPLQLVEWGEGFGNMMMEEVRRIKNLSENFENHFKKFSDKFWKISRNTSDIFEKYF